MSIARGWPFVLVILLIGSATVGTPAANIGGSAGWGFAQGRADAFAGQNTELVFISTAARARRTSAASPSTM